MKPFKCDKGPIFQVANLNGILTKCRPSEIHTYEIRLHETVA